MEKRRRKPSKTPETPETPGNGSVPLWRNRIVGHEEVPAQSLKVNPSNFRVHSDTQRAAVEEAITRLGWIEEVLVNRTTGHMINGHLRVELSAARGETVPVTYVELTEAEERLALASLDPLGTLATEDPARLGDLLAQLDLGHSALDTLLSTAAQDAALAQLFGDSQSKDDNQTGPRLSQHGQNITVVIAVEELSLFERAIRATGQQNRGQAILGICRSYLDAKGQFDL